VQRLIESSRGELNIGHITNGIVATRKEIHTYYTFRGSVSERSSSEKVLHDIRHLKLALPTFWKIGSKLFFATVYKRLL